MTESSLDKFVASVRADWGPINTELVMNCRRHLDDISLADAREEWLASLLAERQAMRELHREPSSFMLLAHAEQRGLYRPPHDHGRAWVVYGVQSGALEIGSYGRVPDSDGERLVLPAFGAFTGGLNVRHQAFDVVFGARPFAAHMLGEGRIYAFAISHCLAD